MSELEKLARKLAETHLKLMRLESIAVMEENDSMGLYGMINDLDIDEYCLLTDLVHLVYEIQDDSVPA